MRVSRSGGWMSVISPHSKRDRSRSSSVEMSRGGRSRRHHDLPARLVEGVERVEELLLDPLLVLEELHVVDQQHVVGAVARLEALDALVAEAVDEVVHERLRRDVAARQPAAVIGDEVRDRVQEMGLSEAGVPVDEERVVGLGGRLGDGERRRVGEAVGRADHERVERVFRVDPCDLAPLRDLEGERGDRRRNGRRRRLRRRGGLDHPEPHLPFPAGGVPDGRADQVEEVALDPLAREVVRDREHEPLAVQFFAVDFAEPGRVSGVVERFTEPGGDVVPEVLRRQLDFALHACVSLLHSPSGVASIAACGRRLNEDFLPCPRCRSADFAGDFSPPHVLHSCGRRRSRAHRAGRTFHGFSTTRGMWTNGCVKRSGYTRRRPAECRLIPSFQTR